MTTVNDNLSCYMAHVNARSFTKFNLKKKEKHVNCLKDVTHRTSYDPSLDF